MRPPSVVLKTPRSSPGARPPRAATNSVSGSFGFTRIVEMNCVSRKPMFVHVAPASSDCQTPSPGVCSPVPTYTLLGRSGHRHRANRCNLNRVKDRLPHLAPVDGLPNASARSTCVIGRVVSRNTRYGRDAPASKRPDQPPAQIRIRFRGTCAFVLLLAPVSAPGCANRQKPKARPIASPCGHALPPASSTLNPLPAERRLPADEVIFSTSPARAEV